MIVVLSFLLQEDVGILFGLDFVMLLIEAVVFHRVSYLCEMGFWRCGQTVEYLNLVFAMLAGRTHFVQLIMW